MLGDEDLVQDGKYRGYVAGMEKALKNFEYSSDWPDLIAALGKLNKVINSNTKYKVIPKRLLLSKRLSQCLHSTLPSGVHLKALETYDLVFKIIGPEKLPTELFIYATGLFPLLDYAGISVRPCLLTLYETHLLPLGSKLAPCLDGFLPGILLGMEETSDFYQRTTALLDSIKTSVGQDLFYSTLWRCIAEIPQARQPSIHYMLANKEEVAGQDLEKVRICLQLCLVDTNILVQRASLELLSTKDWGKDLELVKAALKTLLRRDSSLNRRLYSWLVDFDIEIAQALQSLLCEADEDNFRIMVYLFDKSEFSDKLIDRILVDVVRSLYIHNGTLIRSANLFFSTLHPSYVWEFWYSSLVSAISNMHESTRVQKPGSGLPSTSELCILLTFLITLGESALDRTYLPGLEKKLFNLVSENLSTLGMANLQAFLTLLQCFENDSPENTMTYEQFTKIYKEFTVNMLFNISGNDGFVSVLEPLVQKNPNFYDDCNLGFENGIEESIKSMCSKIEVPIPPLKTCLETLECYKSLNCITGRWCGKRWPNPDLSSLQSLVITSTRADIESFRLEACKTLIDLLNACPEVIKTPLFRETTWVELTAGYLWDRLPSTQNNLLSLYNVFPNRTERVLITRFRSTEIRDYGKVLGLIQANSTTKKENFERLAMTCMDDLDARDMVRKTASESFVAECLGSAIGILIQPLVRVWSESTFAVTKSVLLFERVRPEVDVDGRESPTPTEVPILPPSGTITRSNSNVYTSDTVDYSGVPATSTSTSEVTSVVDGEINLRSNEHDSSAPLYSEKIFLDETGHFKATFKKIIVDNDEFEHLEEGEADKSANQNKNGIISLSPSKERTADLKVNESYQQSVCESPRAEFEKEIPTDLQCQDPGLEKTVPQVIVENGEVGQVENGNEEQGDLETPEDKQIENTEDLQAEAPEIVQVENTEDSQVSDSDQSSGEHNQDSETESMNVIPMILETEPSDVESPSQEYNPTFENGDDNTSSMQREQELEADKSQGTEQEGLLEEEESMDVSLELTCSAHFETGDPDPFQEQSESKAEPDVSELEPEPERRTPSPTPTPILPIKNRLFSIHPYNTAMLVCGGNKYPDHLRALYALRLLKNVLWTSERGVLLSLATSVSESRVTYLELVLSCLLNLSLVFYPDVEEASKDHSVSLNVSVHVEALRLIQTILGGLAELLSGPGFSSFISDMFCKLRLGKTILYNLASLVLVQTESQLTETEAILKRNYEAQIEIVYNELVRLATSIIAVESKTIHHSWAKARVPQAANTYIPNLQLSRQPLYLETLLKSVANSRMSKCHHLTLTSVSNALPHYGAETGRIICRVVESVCQTLQDGALEEVYIGRILESLTLITHYVLLDQNPGEKVEQESSTHLLYSLVSVFFPVVGTVSKDKDPPNSPLLSQRKPAQASLLGLLPVILSTLVKVWTPGLRQKVLDLINPIAFNHIHSFLKSIGKQPDTLIPGCVDLVHSMKVVPLDTQTQGLMNCVRTSEDETQQLTLLTFFNQYLDKCKSLTEIWPQLFGLIKEAPTLPPKCQIVVFSVFYKLATNGLPTGKTELRELQDSGAKLIESVSAHVSTEKKHKGEAQLQLQVLNALQSHLAAVIDIVWGSEEKVLPMLTNVIYYVMGHLKFRFPVTHYTASVTLVSTLSPYSYLRKAWKKEIFELLLDGNFFTFPKECLPFWRTTMDNLFTQDKNTFVELIARVSVPQTGSLNIFTSKEVEYESRAMLLKRLAFVIFCSPKDQYTKHISNIQERLAEAIKMPQLIPIIQTQVFLLFRVLLLRLSQQHLNGLWPIILHEILMVLVQMETDILTKNPTLLALYLSCCKLIELSLSLPTTTQSMFQMYRWSFVGPDTSIFTPHLTRLAKELEVSVSTKTNNGYGALRSTKIDSLGEIYHFLKHAEKVDVQVLESALECDFLE